MSTSIKTKSKRKGYSIDGVLRVADKAAERSMFIIREKAKEEITKAKQQVFEAKDVLFEAKQKLRRLKNSYERTI